MDLYFYIGKKSHHNCTAGQKPPGASSLCLKLLFFPWDNTGGDLSLYGVASALLPSHQVPQPSAVASILEMPDSHVPGPASRCDAHLCVAPHSFQKHTQQHCKHSHQET